MAEQRVRARGVEYVGQVLEFAGATVQPHAENPSRLIISMAGTAQATIDLASHEAGTTAIHGIADTSLLVATDASGDLALAGDVSVGGLFTPSRWRLPYQRTYYVDAGGGADYTTIQGAIDAIEAMRSSTTEDYYVIVGRGSFAEDVEIPRAVHVAGRGQLSTTIAGSVTVHSGGSFQHAWIAAPATADFVIHAVMDVAAVIVIKGVYGRITRSVDAPVVGLKMSGSAVQIVRIHDSYLYVTNTWSGVNTAAKAAVFHLAADVEAYIECFHCHTKTSTSGTATPIFAWVEPVAPTFGYVHASNTDWMAINSLQPVLLESSNTVHPGGIFDVRVFGEAGQEVQMNGPYPDLRENIYPIEANFLNVWGDVRLANTPIITSAGVIQNVSMDAALLTGALADARLSTNVPRLNAANTWTGAGQTMNPAAGSTMFQGHLAGDSVMRSVVYVSGVIDAGPGGATARDLRYGRSGVSTFKIETPGGGAAKLHVTGEAEIDGALNHDGSTVGLYGVAPVVRAAAIASPTGGATVDAESRTAINAIRAALTAIGITL